MPRSATLDIEELTSDEAEPVSAVLERIQKEEEASDKFLDLLAEAERIKDE